MDVETLSNYLPNWLKPKNVSGYTQTGGYSPSAPSGYDPDDFAGLLKKSNSGKYGVTSNGSPSVVNDPSFLQSMIGFKDANGQQQAGWGGLAFDVVSGIGSSYMGMQKLGLAKDTLKENKRQYNQNYQAQRDSINTQYEDRQRARVASNPGAYQSVGEYMDKNRIK